MKNIEISGSSFYPLVCSGSVNLGLVTPLKGTRFCSYLSLATSWVNYGQMGAFVILLTFPEWAFKSQGEWSFAFLVASVPLFLLKCAIISSETECIM